jgi:diacylglycerol kinase family enzyme
MTLSLTESLPHRNPPPRARARQALVIFNASAGNALESAAQLEQVLDALNDVSITPELYRVQPGSRIPVVAAHAARRGVPYVVACGGDNTIDQVARSLSGTGSTLVIVPTGTRNNIARGLEIPTEIPAAVQLIRTGERRRVDMGRVKLVGRQAVFFELATIGLGAALFEAADDVQHGNLARLGDLLGTFVTHPVSTFSLNLDRGRQKLQVDAYLLLVMNLPYLGANYQLGNQVDFADGLLDVFLYANLGKLDLLTYALQVAQGFTDDPRVRHVRVKQLQVETDPPMPVMLDGQVLSNRVLRGRTLTFSGLPRALNVMAPRPGLHAP